MRKTQARAANSASPRARRIAATLVALGLAGTFAAPAAMADDLSDMRSRLAQVKQRQVDSQQEIADSKAQLSAATSKLLDSQKSLADAQARLSDLSVRLQSARDADLNLEADLRVAQAALEQAKQNVAKGEGDLANQLRLMGAAAREAYQQQNPLAGLSILFGSDSTSELSQRIQWNTTIFDTQSADKSRLDEVQATLTAARDAQAGIEARVAAKKEAAAKQVVLIAGLEREANAQADTVKTLVQSNARAQADAQAELAADTAAYDQLASQESQLQNEIQSKLDQLKAEAEQRAREEAARKAAAEAEAKRQAEAKKQAEASASQTSTGATQASSGATTQPPAPATTPQASASDPTGHGTSRYGLVRPISARPGSPFGMRFHPILHYWRMHNGQDFGASTGTPIYAAADGIVLKSGPNGGFGNFVLIGHNASINGKYVTTGYAHQSRIIVSVGQRVRQGQIVGYVGSTGLSTAPHLHFEVRLNGTPVNPMAYVP